MKAPGWLASYVDPARRRVRRMAVEEMSLWVSAAGTEMDQALRSYMNTRDEVQLAEFERGLGILVAMAQELRARRQRD